MFSFPRMVEITTANIAYHCIPLLIHCLQAIDEAGSLLLLLKMNGRYLDVVGLSTIWVFPKIGVPPNHPMFNRVFHYFHHPFWGTPIFGSTPIF